MSQWIFCACGANASSRPGHPVIEPGADVQHHVAAMHRQVRLDGAVHPQHAQELRVGRRVGTQPHQGGGAGRAAEPNQLPQRGRRVRPGVDDAAAAVDDRPPCALQQGNGATDLRGVRVAARPVGAVGLAGRRRVGRRGDQHVLRQVDHHRPGPAAGCDRERLMDDPRQVLAALDQVVVLGRGPGDPRGISLLEGVVADQVRRYLPGQADQGHAVHQRVHQAGHRVGGAGAAGDQHHPDLAGGAGVAFRRMHRRLLVPHQDVPDRVLLVDRVVDRQHSPARVAEHDLHALVLQGLQKDLGAGTMDAGGENHAPGLRSARADGQPMPSINCCIPAIQLSGSCAGLS